MNRKQQQKALKNMKAVASGAISRREFIERMLLAGVGLATAQGMLNVAAAMAQDQPFAGEQIVSTFMQSGTYDKGAEAIQQSFTDETGIELDIVAQPWAVLNQSHITDLTTGTGEFDVMSGEFWIASVYPKMLPLEDYAKGDNFGEGMLEGVWKPGPSGFYNGKRIGVPYSADAYGVVYRTDLFEEHGIEAKWDTWDDFIERLGELQKALEGTDIAPTVFAWGAQEQVPSIFLGMYDSYLLNKDGVYEVDPAKAVPALDKMVSLLQYNPEGAASLSIDEANAVFNTGKAATMVCWVSFMRAAAQDPDQSTIVDKWAVGHFPGPGFPFLSAWNFFISSFSKNSDAAWEWIKYYDNADRAKERFVQFGVGSPWSATYEDEELLENYSHDFPGMVENLNRTKSVPWVFEAFEAFFRNIGELVVGAMTPEDVVSKTNEVWAEITVPEALVQAAEAQGQKQE